MDDMLMLLCVILTTSLLTPIECMSIIPNWNFQNNASIVENDIYNLFWTLDDSSATFEVHAKTLGLVGFGISKTGGMKDADIVTGWVKNGKAYFQDRYSSRNGEPEIDESQDWTLLEGREEGGYTILKFSRPLTNCDLNDIDITQDTMRIIYSWHDTDPEQSTGLPYHGRSNRGTKSLSLVNFVKEDVKTLPPDAFSIDLQFDEVKLPATHTTYYCRGIKMPKLKQKHHIVMVEPLIQPGHEGLVHHFLAYRCPGHINKTRHETINGVCEDQHMLEMLQCQDIVFAYAIGSGANFIPPEAGIPVGGGAPEFFRMEMHYDNAPPSQSGLIDSSGIRLWLTPTLRKYDVMTFSVGLVFNKFGNHIIPPKFKALHNEALCSKGCMQQLFGRTEEVNIFSVMLHTHLLGTAISLRHIRDGEELPPIIEDKYYDFNFQEFRQLKKLRTLKPEDELILDCTYNSESRTNLTFGGESTREEMCAAFIMFYPEFSSGNTLCYNSISPANMMRYLDAEIKITGPRPTDVEILGDNYEGKNFVEIMSETDWTDEDIQKRFQEVMLDRATSNLQLCTALPGQFMPLQMSEVTKPYVVEESCKKTNPSVKNPGADNSEKNPTDGNNSEQNPGDGDTLTSSTSHVLSSGLPATIITFSLLYILI